MNTDDRREEIMVYQLKHSNKYTPEHWVKNEQFYQFYFFSIKCVLKVIV